MTGRPFAIPILTYHSISEAAGPTCMPLGAFKAQMQAIKDLGVYVAPIEHILKWVEGGWTPERRTIAITFDDAFEDFARAAHPILADLGFPSCVFAPTKAVGGEENWAGAGAPPKRLMDWRTITDLSQQGVSFGSHAQTHPDLTRLDDVALAAELDGSAKELEARLGKPTLLMAPPYGRSNDRVRAAIARRYGMSFGVRLGEARATSPRYDMPRIEMHYFRNIDRWRSFLAGKGGAYLGLRRGARIARSSAMALGRAVSG